MRIARPGKVVDRLAAPASQTLHRLAEGLGLRQLRTLERAVDDLAESVTENSLLAPELERRVRWLEHSLVPLLEARRSRNDRG